MEIKDFIKNLADQYEDVEVNEFTPETKFKEFDEWSSLISLSIIAMVDDEYGITLKGDDIRKVDTVQELFDVVKSKK
ncbi:MAG: acyl carrier protein [Bacteroidales bacterium]|jgi:acyl carrier protein|nr:acyl carrier protein [Bacteroidales bacterium]